VKSLISPIIPMAVTLVEALNVSFRFVSFLFFKILFIFQRARVRERERERAHRQEEWQVEGEAGSQLSGEPDAGLNPRTQGS